MNIKHRVASALRPWWTAIAEEPADSRDFDEWSALCMTLLKYSFAAIVAFTAILLTVHYTAPFASESVIVTLGGAMSDMALAGLGAMIFGAGVLAVKASLVKEQNRA